MTSQDYIEMEEQYGAHNYHPLDIVIEKAEGVWVYDVDGKKYMDCLSAYSAVNQGHCHPRILKAMVEQAQKVTLTSRAFRNDKLPFLYKKLCELAGVEMVLPMNSGAEAVETAIKAARKWGYKRKGVESDKAEIIVCKNNFHGRTTTIVGFATEEQYKDGFGPFSPGFIEVPFDDLNALKSAVNKNTVAFMFEPIQGEGGILMPDENYLAQAQKLCKENNVLFIADEIQTGLGRTGKMFAYEHYVSEKPDMLIVGKALSGGFYPVSAVLSSKEILGVFNPGDHGSTFGGNPLACAVAMEALNVIVEEGLVERSDELGDYLIKKLKTINTSKIKEIRGKGLFIGIELNEAARPYCEALKQDGLLCKETHENVIRLAPPLVIGKEEIDWAIDKVKTALEA
ncbi:MAG: ornithine--oxo-acid transaminase [Calditrichaeota bacterium]|nr:MAG: ornithine--oxo-acid transaminase [Calditrichota bacterium]MBL1205777.1 ornithine--oxo-acid transaminase [Calditrichota bacterium]NOG45605.1 ornithine--oxo-acid transaminase [Calditrichota bacterium]